MFFIGSCRFIKATKMLKTPVYLVVYVENFLWIIYKERMKFQSNMNENKEFMPTECTIVNKRLTKTRQMYILIIQKQID